MSGPMQRPIAIFLLIGLGWSAPVTTSALISVFEGNDPVQNMGWPTGAEEVANLPSRLGYMMGPPFGGGEYYFQYHCNDTSELNTALRKFSAIRAPRTTRRSLISLDGQITQLTDEKPLLLVVHDWPKDRENVQETGSRVDWTFTVWTPEHFHDLFSDPKSTFSSDHPNYRQPVPAPRIDVYVDGGGPIEWRNVEVPPNVRILDQRPVASPVSTADGGVIRGGVYDMATHQVIAGAAVILAKRAEPSGWEETARATTNRDGLFVIQAVPEGYFEIHVSAEGYVGRTVGNFNNRTGHAYCDFDALLIGQGSLTGVVTDPEGNPIPGVRVTASEPLGIDGLGYPCVDTPSVVTDDEGRFVLNSLPQGFTHLRCLAASMHQATSIFELYRVSTRPWEQSGDIRIVMTGTGVVRGKVIGRDGKAPTRPFVVEIEPKGGHVVGSWGGSMQCKTNGEFEFQGVPPGEYSVIARPNPMREGEASPPESVVVAPGKTVDLNIFNANAQN